MVLKMMCEMKEEDEVALEDVGRCEQHEAKQYAKRGRQFCAGVPIMRKKFCGDRN